MSAPPYPLVAACVDGSTADAPVVAEAAALGLLDGARLVLLHVAQMPTELGDAADASWIGLGVPPDPAPFENAARSRLEAAQRLAPRAEAVLLDGDPGIVVCDWSTEHGVDLLVAGAHRGRIERLTLGSFAGFVAHHAPCPVLLVRPIPAD